MTETTNAQTTALTHEPAAETGVLGTLGINMPLFIAQLVNVAIVLLVLRAFVFKPLVKMLEERRQKIEAGVAHAAEADKRLASAKQEEASLHASAKAEARGIVDEARAKGEAERAERVAQAAHDIDRQVADAKEKIASERTEATNAVRREMAGLVLAATKKVTAGDLDEAAHLREIDRAIAELESAKA
jgi:F-type H+-transporting ATPase subunit b